ncbi:beta-eliminating lyase-related protein, partial [Burkholderia gladioli]|nr:beta-eliminating lyase-related protein [Burkholderia gladioli]
MTIRRYFDSDALTLSTEVLACEPDEEAGRFRVTLAETLFHPQGGGHTTQPSAVSITQATEVGSVYTLDEIGTIGEICREANLPLHMDGARFANALVSLGCSPAEMT